MKITTTSLRKLKACESSINRFGITYPDGLVIPDGTKIIEIDCSNDNCSDDIRWLLNQKIISNIDVVFKYKNGYWEKYEYDEKGNKIKYENLDGFWIKYEYDENMNMIKYENSNGNWKKYEYDENGNMIKYKNPDGFWKKFEYDENGNKTKFEDSDGYWKKYEYDENRNEIKFEGLNGCCGEYQILPYNFKIKMIN